MNLGRKDRYEEIRPEPVENLPEPISAEAPKPRRWLLVLPALALVLAGIWWGTRPRQLRLVSRQALASMTVMDDCLVPGADGYVFHYPDRVFTYFAWDGAQRWQVHLPPETGQYGISDNLRYLTATLSAGENSMRLLTWTEGRLTGNVCLPMREMRFFQFYPSRTPPLNDGRVLVVERRLASRERKVFLIQGSRVLAQGRLPADIMRFVFSPDGAALIGSSGMTWAYFHVTHTNSTLRFTPVYTLPDSSRLFLDPLSEGLFMLEDGSIYGPSGGIETGNGWETVGIWPRSVTRIVVQDSHRFSRMGQNRAFRVYDTRSHKAWKIPSGEVIGHCIASRDGRFAVVHEEDVFRLHPLLEHVVRNIDELDRWYQAKQQRRRRLAIYERPGKLRAQLMLGEAFDFNQEFTGANDLVLSPDGHSLLIRGEIGNQGNGDWRLELRRYQW